jgi:hypothetical protein
VAKSSKHGSHTQRSKRRARAPAGSGIVVRTRLPRRTPARPRSRISRATVALGHRDVLPVQLQPDLPCPVDAEILGMTPGDLRFEQLVALTRLRKAGMALEAVQAQAGHASIESTRIYLHPG